MADFCFQCSLDMFFGPHSDFDHFGKPGGILHGHEGHVVAVMCEGCGPTFVDHRGRCVSDCCLMSGHGTPGQREVLRSAEEWLAARSGRWGWLLRLRDRLLGTPWEPGMVHQWRWRWYDILDRARGPWKTDSQFEFQFDADYASQDGAILPTGNPGDVLRPGPIDRPDQIARPSDEPDGGR